MAKSFVELGVKDSGFNAAIKNAMRTFASLGGAANSAKGAFSKMADGLAQVAQSQQMVNAALKGNPYGMLAQVATIAFTKIIEKTTEATEAERRAMEWAEERSERAQAANEAIGRSTGELLAKYELLRYEWGRLSSAQEKNDWINQNQSAFKGLNLAVTDVTSAENVFVKNTSQVVAALKARAEAEAYADLYKNKIKENAMNKSTGKYKPQLITDKNYRPSEIEAQAAGFTAANKAQMYEYKMVENADPRNPGYHREWTGRLSDEGLRRLNQNRMMGANTLENADRMGAEYWANLMVQAQKNAAELGKGLLNAGGSGGGGKGGGSSNTNLPDISDWDKAFRKGMIDTDKLKEAKELISPFAMMTEEAKKQMLGLSDATVDLGGAMAEIGNQKVLDEIEAATKRIEQQQKATDLAAQSAMNLGAALSNIEDPGMKAAGTVLSAVANIALGFSQAAAQASSLGPYAWIAYLAAGTAAMATTISTIHSLTGYAQGGIVDGNSYSGDNIPIMANAGELVLTKAAQASLANHLEGGGMSGLGPSRISGEQIYITLNRYLKRSGQGELMTWG